MKSKTIEYFEYTSEDELKPEYHHLLSLAREASHSAYAPYSGFHVGAAVLLANKEIITGNNQENAAYPSGLCAERVAIFAASAGHPGIPITAIAIYAATEKFDFTEPVAPCGSCRQVMTEYEKLFEQDITIIMGSVSGKVIMIQKADDLLPFAFHEKKLKIK